MQNRYRSSDIIITKIFPVLKECNMIDFAKEKVDNYDPDSGYGYYQFTEGTEEYISPMTQVVLISQVSIILCSSYNNIMNYYNINIM